LNQAAVMKLSIRTTFMWGGIGVACATALSAAETARDLTAHARTAQPAVATEPAAAPLPVSTFNLPRKAAEGRDPFFPLSTRMFTADQPAPTNRTGIVTADLTLRGLSGSPERPLAIINTTTFGKGDTSEVIVKNDRLRVTCVEIDMATGTALVEVGGERRQLRLAAEK
jgi:hypothetical protein